MGLPSGTGPVNAATTRARTHDYATAERLWRSVVRVRPEQPRALLNLGQALREQGRVDEAIGHLRRLLSTR